MKATLESEWDAFRRETIDPEAGPEQLRDMKTAFFAGAQSAKWILHQPIKAAALALNGMQDEITRYSLELVPCSGCREEVTQ